MCTASVTGVMPYSETITTCWPSRSAGSISSPQTASISSRSLIRRGMREVRAEALQVVVEVRQVAERQGRLAGLHDVAGRVADPLAGGDVGHRAPELEQGEHAELGAELVAQLRGMGVVVGDLAAVGGIHRARRRAPVRRGVHVVPPEHLGAGEVRVRALPASQIFSPPTRRFDWRHSQTSERSRKYQPLADRAVARRRQAGHQGRLGRAGHRRQHRGQRPQPALLGQAFQIGRVFPDQGRREPDDQYDQGVLHGSDPRGWPGPEARPPRRFPIETRAYRLKKTAAGDRLGSRVAPHPPTASRRVPPSPRGRGM